MSKIIGFVVAGSIMIILVIFIFVRRCRHEWEWFDGGGNPDPEGEFFRGCVKCGRIEENPLAWDNAGYDTYLSLAERGYLPHGKIRKYLEQKKMNKI